MFSTVPALARASAATMPTDTQFSAKCKKFRELKIALDRLYKTNNVKLEKIVGPEIPNELLEPLQLPSGNWKSPEKEGWSQSDLERLADKGNWEVFVKSENAGRMIISSGFKSVSPKTKDRAAELLPIRVAYDAAHQKWFAKIMRIENSTSRPMDKMDNALIEVMKLQATHLGELFQKIQISKEADLFADHTCPGRREKTTIKCLFRDIEKLAQQGSSA